MGVSRYDEEFRARAVAMVLKMGKTPVQVGKELGVTSQTIRDWVQRHEGMQRSEYARIQELEREIKSLRKELAKSQEAVEILKKTALILGER